MNMKDRLAKAYGQGADKKETGQNRGNDASSEKSPARNTERPSSRPAPAKSAATGTTSGKRDGGKARQSASGGLYKTGPAPTPKTIQKPSGKAASNPEALFKSGKSGMEKAAKFLMLLGRDEAAAVIRHLKPAEIEEVSKAIAGVDRIDTAEANEILTEFGWLAKTQGASLQGGPDIAEGMLAAAFGSAKAREVIKRVTPPGIPFAFLNDLDSRHIVLLLKDESPQVMAIILPHLEPKLASTIIEQLSPAVRTDVVKRIASLDRMSPEVLERVESVLRDRLAVMGRPEEGQRIDGASVLAGILKHVGGGLDETILRGLGEDNPELSQEIRERLFTADDLYRVSDRDVQKSLRELSERDIALVLKGKSQSFKDKILANVSQSKRTMVLEEYDIMGTVRRDDADKATRAYLEWFKRRYESGELVLEGDEDLID